MIQHPAATHLVHKSSTLCRDLGHKCLSSTTYMHTFSSWPKYQRWGYFKLRIQLCLLANQLSHRFRTSTEVLFYGVWLLDIFQCCFAWCHHGSVDPSKPCQVAPPSLVDGFCRHQHSFWLDSRHIQTLYFRNSVKQTPPAVPSGPCLPHTRVFVRRKRLI